jgi:hypothetical protein
LRRSHRLTGVQGEPGPGQAQPGIAGDDLGGERVELGRRHAVLHLDLRQVELVARFIKADGIRAGNVFSQTLAFSLRPATYASMLQTGVRYQKEIEIPAKAVELKVLVGSLASGKSGTLTIPLSAVQLGAAR